MQKHKHTQSSLQACYKLTSLCHHVESWSLIAWKFMDFLLCYTLNKLYKVQGGSTVWLTEWWKDKQRKVADWQDLPPALSKIKFKAPLLILYLCHGGLCYSVQMNLKTMPKVETNLFKIHWNGVTSSRHWHCSTSYLTTLAVTLALAPSLLETSTARL